MLLIFQETCEKVCSIVVLQQRANPLWCINLTAQSVLALRCGCRIFMDAMTSNCLSGNGKAIFMFSNKIFRTLLSMALKFLSLGP